MITPSFSPTATERVLPKLALDFTTASLDSRVTFTRTTDATHPATYVNSNGYVTAATDNQPRFDYSPTALTCNGLLIEESRSNVFTYSEDATNWNGVTGGSLTGSFASPANTSTANLFTEDTSTGEHYVRKNITGLTANTNYSVSFFVKSNGRNFRVRVLDTDNTANGYYATYNSSTGAVINSSNVGSGVFASTVVTTYGNSWYRVTVTGNGGATCTKYTIDLMLTLPGGGTTSFTGTGTLGLYFWGAQVEVGAFPTSYIPTTTTALTRNADVATMTGTNFSSWYNATQGTFQLEVLKSVGNSARFLVVQDARNNFVANGYDIDMPDATTIRTEGFTSSANQWALTRTFTLGYIQKTTLGYATNNIGYSSNGTATVTDVSATIPTLTHADLGNWNGSNQMNGWIRKINYWSQKLTSSEIQAFSK